MVHLGLKPIRLRLALIVREAISVIAHESEDFNQIDEVDALVFHHHPQLVARPAVCNLSSVNW